MAGKKTGKSGRREAGFTLLELMVVIFIIALAAGIVFPRLPEPEGTRLKSSARNLASGIRFLNDQAIITKKVYRLHLELGENTTRISELSPTGEEMQPRDQFMGRRLVEEGIDIEDVERELIRQALEVSEGNQSKAAKKLNLGIDAFRYRMKKFGFLQ